MLRMSSGSAHLLHVTTACKSSTRSSILRPEQRLDHELLLAVLGLALEQGEDLVLTFEDLDRLRGQRVDGVQCFVVGFCAGIACGCLDVLAHHDGDHCQGLKYATDDQQHEGEGYGCEAEWAHLRQQHPAPDEDDQDVKEPHVADAVSDQQGEPLVEPFVGMHVVVEDQLVFHAAQHPPNGDQCIRTRTDFVACHRSHSRATSLI